MSTLARPAPRLLAVAGLAAVAAWLSSDLAAALDRDVHARYAGLFAEASRTQAVLLVAIDATTLAGWGPPPWSEERTRTLADVLEAGAPRLIIWPEGQVGSEAPDGAAAPAIAGEMPADVARVATKGVDPLIGAPLVREKDPTFPAAALRALGLPVRDGPLPAHYVSRLPSVPATRVAAGEIPATTFRDRVVIVGRSDPAAATVTTPLGPMSPAQVEAHALLGAMDGVAWTDPPPALRKAAVAAWALGLAALLRRRGPLGACIVAVTAVGVAALVDLGLFAAGLVRVGVGAAAVVAVAAALAQLVLPGGPRPVAAPADPREREAPAVTAASGLHKVSDA